jgi:hypothetical protein
VVLVLKFFNELILVLDNSLDAKAAHNPVVLEPFLKIRVFELGSLIVLVDVLKQLFHGTINLLIWVSLHLRNVGLRRQTAVGILVARYNLLVLLVKLLRGIEVVDLLDVDLPIFFGAQDLIEYLAKLVFQQISLWLSHTDPVVKTLKVRALVGL